MKAEFHHLSLLSAIYYVPCDFFKYEESIITDYIEKDKEMLFCYELNESEAKKFEPDKKFFPGTLIFTGKALNSDKPGKSTFELKKGSYLFSQIPELLNMEDIIELAMEVQNEGLWQRLKLLNFYYVRFLFEDGRGVTQIWRPYEAFAKTVNLQFD